MKYIVFPDKLISLSDLKMESGLETTRSENQKKVQTWIATFIFIKTLIILEPVLEQNEF